MHWYHPFGTGQNTLYFAYVPASAHTVSEKPSARRMLSTKKNPTRHGAIVTPSHATLCWSQTPAISFLPEPTAWPHSALSTWLNASGGTTMSVVTMSDKALAAR